MNPKFTALIVTGLISVGYAFSPVSAAPVAKKPVAAAKHAIPAAKKPYTITDRVTELRTKVEAGQKENELTAKEATKLTCDLDNISNDIEKMKVKNAGKLSYSDEGKIEKRLNKVSLALTKCQLEKRVTPH